MSHHLTTKFLSVWTGAGKTKINSFLDLPTKESQEFFEDTINDFFLQKKNIANITAEENKKLLTFALIQMSKYLEPQDNSKFLLKTLIHLEKNPVFSNLLSKLMTIEIKEISEGTISVPELGVFVAPNLSNRYTFAIPRSPKSVFLVYLGANNKSYTDQELADYSLSTKGAVLTCRKGSITPAKVRDIQKLNSVKIGSLTQQMEDPAPISSAIKNIVLGMSGIKTDSILKKPVDMALRFLEK